MDNPDKKTVEAFLESVDYKSLNEGNYLPSAFSLKFVNFIKMAGAEEENLTPVVHLKMLDLLPGKSENIVNLCCRGLGKTVVFAEYLSLFLGVFGVIDGFGKVNGMLYVSDSMDNGVKVFRSNVEHKWNASEFLQYWIPKAKFTENFIEFERRDGTKFGIRMYGAQSGIRGTKIFGKRPQLVVMDDLIQSDEDAASEAVMGKIRNNIYKSIVPALDPGKRKIILNGTPFNQKDIMYEAVESGKWDVNVWPVCEEWPTTPELFQSVWPDRFTYENVQKSYDLNAPSFQQEMMLRIVSDEDRLIMDWEITKFNLKAWKASKVETNRYITTDFATTEKKSGDWSVMSVWDVDSEGNYKWIDGVMKKQNMGGNVDDLFTLVKKYNPLGVGIEVAGQQGGFIPWLKREMIDRGLYFNLLSNKGYTGNPGIRVTTSKLQRIQEIIPLIKAGKIQIPEDSEHPWVKEFWAEIRTVMKNGIKSRHDDVLDTVSQLIHVVPVLPSKAFKEEKEKQDYEEALWVTEDTENPRVGINNYLP